MPEGRKIKNFVKSQPLFDVHRQYLQAFLIDLQAGVSRFPCRIFRCFAYFFRIYLHYHRVLSFISYPLVIVLHLESPENSLFELDFLVSKHVFLRLNLLRKVNFLARF